MRAADVFADQRAALRAVITDARAMIAGAPEEAHGQVDRLNAWCTATEQFLDSRFWHSAVDVEEAQRRAVRAARIANAAATTAKAQGEAAAATAAAVAETNADHSRRYPAPKLG